MCVKITWGSQRNHFCFHFPVHEVRERTNARALNFSSVNWDHLNCYDTRICGNKYYCRELSTIFVVICVVFLSHLCSRFLIHNAVLSLRLEVWNATSINVQFWARRKLEKRDCNWKCAYSVNISLCSCFLITEYISEVGWSDYITLLQCYG